MKHTEAATCLVLTTIVGACSYMAGMGHGQQRHVESCNGVKICGVQVRRVDDAYYARIGDDDDALTGCIAFRSDGGWWAKISDQKDAAMIEIGVRGSIEQCGFDDTGRWTMMPASQPASAGVTDG